MIRLRAVAIILVLGSLAVVLGGCKQKSSVESMQTAVDIGLSYYQHAIQEEGLEFYRGVYIFYDANEVKNLTPHYNLTFYKELEDAFMLDMIQLNPMTSEVSGVDTSFVALDALQPVPMDISAYNCPIATVLSIVKAKTGTDWANMAFKIRNPLALAPDLTTPGCWELATMASNGDRIAVVVDLNKETATPVTPTPEPVADPMDSKPTPLPE